MYLQVFTTELERVPIFGNFSDFLHTFNLWRDKNAEEEEEDIVGEVKVLHI